MNSVNDFELTDRHDYLRMDELTYFGLITKVAPINETEKINNYFMRFLATRCRYDTLKFFTVISS